MKTIKKTMENIITSSPKVSIANFNFSKWNEKMKKEIGGNFRQRAERAGVPPEKVKDFKYWLRDIHDE